MMENIREIYLLEINPIAGRFNFLFEMTFLWKLSFIYGFRKERLCRTDFIVDITNKKCVYFRCDFLLMIFLDPWRSGKISQGNALGILEKGDNFF